MSKKMLFIFNPRSGKGQIRNKLLDIIDVFVKGGYEVIVHPTQGPRDGCNMARDMANEVDLIVCSGGDGTLDEIVTGLMEVGAKVPLGYIPAGSTNDFANSLEIPRDMVAAARDIIEGELFSLDVGAFNDDTFVYIAAFGLFTDVSYQTSQNLKNILGHLAYVMEGAKRIFDVQSYWVKVEANGEVFEDEYIYGMITNSHSVGGFKNLTGQDVEMNDGLFEVTLIKKPKNPLELNEIIASLLNAFDDTDMIDAFKTDCLKLECVEPIPWTLDGEFGGDHLEVKIENKKQALDILINP
ncbi:MAG: diacylglycerol kinase family lipid kinase [Clostridia bacterium]|nr:diacylglycerol kinase family lipid kinase [Clostridia bacterium]